MDGDSTKCVHAGEPFEYTTGSVTTPIYQTTTFAFRDALKLAKNVKEGKGYIYTRWTNPTIERLEEKLSILEETDESAFFSSGMAAITTSVLSFMRKGEKLVAIRDLYGETYRFFTETLPMLGIEVKLVDTGSVLNAREELKDSKMLYIETPTNPTMKVVDIENAAKLAHENGAMLVVDNTFASPINQKPFKLGADLVIHSATKYLNGHADVTAGAVAGRKEDIQRVKRMRRILGGIIDPLSAWLVLRGMKTLAIRVREQNANALKLAEYLQNHSKVRRVNYPGLRSNPQHELARKQMKGFGGMLSFEIKGGMNEAMKFTQSLKVASLAASLGGVETLVSQPATLTHTQLSEDDKLKTGISEALIRVSVGIEDIEDIIMDFDNALSLV